MPRSIPDAFTWTLDPSDPQAVPNARVARALLLCFHRLPGTFPSHQYEDLAQALVPVMALMSSTVAAAIKAQLPASQHDVVQQSFPSLEQSSAWQDQDLLNTIGEGLGRSMTAYRKLTSKLLELLDTFVATHGHPTDHNIKLLSELLGLEAHETAFLQLAAACSASSIPRSLFDFVPFRPRLFKVIETTCAGTQARIGAMFEPQSALVRAGLLACLSGRRRAGDLEDLLQLSDQGERLLSTPFTSAAEMSAAVLTPVAPSGEKDALNWPHLATQRALILAVLSEALTRHERGINILLFIRTGNGQDRVRPPVDRVVRSIRIRSGPN